MNRIVLNRQTVQEQQKYYSDLTIYTLHKRLQNLIKSFINYPRSYPVLQGSYILLVDGLWYNFNNQYWILYIFLLKPKKRNYAYILDPVMIKGRENLSGWNKAILTIPNNIKKRIIAFVSDDLNGFKRIAQQNNWIHQLCHFHLLMELRRRRGRRQKNTLIDYPIREAIYQNVQYLLYHSNDVLCKQKTLLRISNRPDCPKKMGMIVREFLRNINRYQSYLVYPRYTIPKTTGACESLAKMIRQRTNTLKTPESVERWAIAFARLRKTMICNGIKRNFPQN